MRIASAEVHPVDSFLLGFCDPVGTLDVGVTEDMEALMVWIMFARVIPAA